MTEGKHYEIERKYLIRYPNIQTLLAQKDVEQWEIVQIYLTVSGPGETRRIRQVVSGGEIKYYKTFKRHLSSVKNEEDEGEIDQMEYIRLSKEQQPGCKPLNKTRYRIPYEGHVLERVLLIGGGLALIIPGTLTDFIGLGVIVLGVAMQVIRKRAKAAA